MSKNLLRNNFILFLFFNLANFLQLLFTILIIRNLTGNNFINYSSLNSLLALLTLPAGAFTIGISSYLSKTKKSLRNFIGVFNALIVIFFVAIFFFLIFIKDIGDYIKIDNKEILYLLIIICLTSYVNSIFLAFYNANKKYLKLCIFNLIPFILKLIFLIYFFFVDENYNYEQIFYCIFFSSFISFLIYLLDFFKNAQIVKIKFNVIDFRSLQKPFFIFISLIITHFFLNYDIMLLRSKLDSFDLDSKFGAINIVKISIYITSMLPLLIASENSRNKKKIKNNLYYIISISFFIQVLSLIFLFLLPDFFFKLIFNFSNTKIFNEMLLIYAPILISINLAALINTFFISVKNYKGIIIQAIIIIFFYYYSIYLEINNEKLIFNFLITSSIIILIFNFLFFFKNK
jgi:hypothetical protein